MFRHKGLLVGIGAIVSILLLGCASTASTLPAASTASPVVQAFTHADPESGRCQVDVMILHPGIAVTLDVWVEVEAGILFANNTTKSDVQRKQMLGTDERQLTFPCWLNTPAVQLPGAYVVRAVVTYAGSDQVIEVAYNNFYIQLTDGQIPLLLASREMYERLYVDGYTRGTGGLYYRTSLDGSNRQGAMYVRVPGVSGAAGPTLTVRAAEGFQFINLGPGTLIQQPAAGTVTAQLPPIAEGGERVLRVPFSVESSIGPGRYSVEVIADYHSHQLAEVAPHYMRVVADEVTGQSNSVTIEVVAAVLLAPHASTPPREIVPETGPSVPEHEGPELHEASSLK